MKGGKVLKTIKEEQRIPIVKRVDIVIVGGGPAGIVSALASARNRAKTLLIERFGALGGMAISGLSLLTFHDTHGQQVIRGIAQEIIDRLADVNGTLGHIEARLERKVLRTLTPIDPEKMKVVVLEMIKDSEVDLSLYTWGVNSIVSDKKIEGIIIESKSGRQAILAKRVIDATGDADIAYKAGVKINKGRPQDGKMQPVSLPFIVGNVDMKKLKEVSPQQWKEICEQGNKAGELPQTVGKFWYTPLPMKRLISINSTRVLNIDGTNVFDLTRAEIKLREQVFQVLSFLRKRVPGFQSSILVKTAPQVGIRETRRIVGKYVLSGEDVINERNFHDTIARGAYPIDIHNPSGIGTNFTPLKSGGSYGIPYRCLIPKHIQGLLVAGRCISVDYKALASVRVMATCMAMGQAAGTAAARSIKENKALSDISISELQKTLKEQKAII